MTDDLNLTIRKLQAEDGDIILLTTQAILPPTAVEYLQDKIATLLTSLNVNAKVLVLDCGIDVKIIKTSQLQTVSDEPQ